MARKKSWGDRSEDECAERPDRSAECTAPASTLR